MDYRTGQGTPLTAHALVESLERWQTALHEWLGLAVYGVTRGERASRVAAVNKYLRSQIFFDLFERIDPEYLRA